MYCGVKTKHAVRLVTSHLIKSKWVLAFILHDKHRVNSLEAGLEVKYLIMLLCITGIRQQQRTTAFTAIMPEATAWREKAHVNREKRH